MKKLTPDLLRFKIHGDDIRIDGAYQFPHPKIKDYLLRVIASSGMGWQHVSVSMVQMIKAPRCISPYLSVKRTPTWSEMCHVKDLFWDVEEWVVQFHPAHSQYVNAHQYCLHLWCPDQGFPIPRMDMVGEVTSKPTYFF